MPTNTNELELLSPARDTVCGIAAIDCGADAVYIGGPSFGARRAASNTVAEIEKLARYAKRFGAKVYAALNTILFEEELEEAARLARELWEAGVDALIVQDMAFLEFDLPPIPLHASTQCDNRTPEKVRFLEEAGFSRVILARELTPGQIAKIRAETSVELECFVHGALCVSHSGQCYLSARMTGRSANRGECAQPCRLPCDLLEGSRVVARNLHLLSLKDMMRVNSLENLAQAGVTSFKIEGRLKDEGYVKNITALYRRELDRILAASPNMLRASSGTVTHGFTPDPDKSFNRGFTEFWLKERNGDYTSFETPKHLGEAVGEVRSVKGGKLLCALTTELANGDGLAWFDSSGALCGFRVNVVEGETLHPAGTERLPPAGAKLFRNFDARFEKALASSSVARKIAVNVLLRERPGGFDLLLTDEEGFWATAPIDAPPIAAKNPDRAVENVAKLLTRLGETIFVAHQVLVEWREPCFIPPALLNAARREATAKLEALREGGRERAARMMKGQPPTSYPTERVDYRANVANSLSKRFYERHGALVAEPAFEVEEQAVPATLMTSIHCLRREFGLCPRRGGSDAGPLTLSLGSRMLTLTFDCAACVMTVSG